MIIIIIVIIIIIIIIIFKCLVETLAAFIAFVISVHNTVFVEIIFNSNVQTGHIFDIKNHPLFNCIQGLEGSNPQTLNLILMTSQFDIFTIDYHPMENYVSTVDKSFMESYEEGAFSIKIEVLQ